jgi:hypothetical protein
MKICALILALLCLTATPLIAQDAADGDRVRLVLTDGTTVVGTIESQTEAEMRLRTDAGVTMNIPRESIRRVEVIGDRRFTQLDPNKTRLLFAPTARPIPQGAGYVAIYELFFPFVAYGITEWGSLSGGISLLPVSPQQLLYFAPKFTFYEQDRTAIGGGFMAVTTIGQVDDDFDIPVFGIAFGLLTQGTAERSVTLGAGLGYADGQFARNPAFLVGGELQLSNSVKLLTENYVVFNVEDAILLGGGIRFFGTRLAADFGLFTNPALLGEGGFPFIPWLGFAYNFGAPR